MDALLAWSPEHLLALWHMGSLHPAEKVMVALLAFGPFLVLGVVVHLARRRQIQEQGETEVGDERVSDPPPAT